MMTMFPRILALLVALSSPAHAEGGPSVGVRHVTAYAAARGGDLDVTV